MEKAWSRSFGSTELGNTFGLSFSEYGMDIHWWPSRLICLESLFEWVTKGVKQGNILSPMIFNIVVNASFDFGGTTIQTKTVPWRHNSMQTTTLYQVIMQTRFSKHWLLIPMILLGWVWRWTTPRRRWRWSWLAKSHGQHLGRSIHTEVGNGRVTSIEQQAQANSCRLLSMRSQCVQSRFETEPLVKEMDCGWEENGNESEAILQAGSRANIDSSRVSVKQLGSNLNQQPCPFRALFWIRVLHHRTRYLPWTVGW